MYYLNKYNLKSYYDTRKKINYSFQINNTLSNLIKREIDSFDNYEKVLFSYLTIVIQHHKSITMLINKETLSALTLLRPMYETYIKLSWLMVFFNTKKIDKVISKIYERKDNNSFPTLDKMTKELDEVYSKVQSIENKNYIHNHLENNKKLFHSYTHTGSYLVSLVLYKNDKFTDSDKINILNEISSFLILSFNSYAFITKDPLLAKRLENEFMKF